MKSLNKIENIEDKTKLFQKNPLIKLNNIYKIYPCKEKPVIALKNINIEINHGDFLAIVGQSGSGKSTLMNILGCLDVPTRGNYLINGKSVLNMKSSDLSRLRNKEIGFIFQKFNLIPTLNALENVELPLIYRKVDRLTRCQLAKKALIKVGLGSRLKHKPDQLSGGQQQRVAIARAIVGNPPIILADEPTGNLDSKAGTEVMNILKHLNSLGKTIILITHDNDIAKSAKRLIRVHDGQII